MFDSNSKFKCINRNGRLELTYYSIEPHEDPVSGLERISRISIARRNAQERRASESGSGPASRASEQSMESSGGGGRAAAHTLSDKYESLDYEIAESELYRAAESHKDHQASSFHCV